MTTPGLRPLSFGEVLDVAVKLYQRHWRTLFPLVLAVVVPVQIVGGIVLATTVPDTDVFTGTVNTNDLQSGDVALYYVGQLVNAVLFAVSTLLVTAALVRALGEAYLGRRPTWQESLSFAFARIGALLWLSVLVGLGIAAGLLLCCVGALFPYTAWAVAFPALVIEGVRGTGALNRSWTLVKPHFWWVLGLLLIAFLIVLVAQVVIGLVIGAAILTNLDSVVLAATLSTLANIVAYTLTTPFSAAVTTVLYFDLRVKNEGFDLQQLARGLDGPLPATP